MISVLSGGVGAARLLSALLEHHPNLGLNALVNVADDMILHGLSICPDLDTITYTLAGLNNSETGWGLSQETWRVMDELEALGGQTWFRLGDRDLATHLYRSQRLSEGATKSEVARELAERRHVGVCLMPISDDPVATILQTERGRLSFQEYFVEQRHSVVVHEVHYEGAEAARLAPGVERCLREDERIIIAPSNPILSIGPILAVESVREILAERREDVIAVSPIVNGTALKGPADRLLGELGLSVSVLGVAQYYDGLIGTLVIDESDAELADSVRDLGLSCVVTTTVMNSPEHSRALCEALVP